MADPRTVELLYAVDRGDAAAARAALDAGADAEAEDGLGRSALCCAAGKGDASVVALLLDRGADINRQWRHFVGGTPLHFACGSGHVATARLLVERGANVGATDKVRNTPLYTAARDGHAAVVALLREHGAMDVKDEDGCTALHLAADRNDKATATVLLCLSTEQIRAQKTSAAIRRCTSQRTQDTCRWRRCFLTSTLTRRQRTTRVKRRCTALLSGATRPLRSCCLSAERTRRRETNGGLCRHCTLQRISVTRLVGKRFWSTAPTRPLRAMAAERRYTGPQ